MNVKPVRIGFSIYALLALLALGPLLSCDKTWMVDPRADLIQSLNGADVRGYLFSLNEEEGQMTSALTNKAVEDIITLGKRDTGLVLRYARIEDKKTNAKRTYKSEVTNRDGSLEFVVTDMATKAVVVKRSFPAAGPTCEPSGQFDSVKACIDEFNCTTKGLLQCQANRTCDNQFAALTCCLKDGSAISVHLIIPPDNPRCQIDWTTRLQLMLSEN